MTVSKLRKRTGFLTGNKLRPALVLVDSDEDVTQFWGVFLKLG